MLRIVEERTEFHIRPEAGWNRARMVEWIVSQVVEDSVEPIRLGGIGHLVAAAIEERLEEAKGFLACTIIEAPPGRGFKGVRCRVFREVLPGG